jgi:hypothetical protein
MQRLMQAPSAYASLGLVKGHKHFLQYIPRAVRSLRDAAAKIENCAASIFSRGTLIERHSTY